MAGTKESGIKVKQTLYQKYGEDYFKEMGRKGGKAKSPLKGFGSSHQRAVEAGRKGGKISKRGKHTMYIRLTQEQINYINHYYMYRDVTSACDLALSLATKIHESPKIITHDQKMEMQMGEVEDAD